MSGLNKCLIIFIAFTTHYVSTYYTPCMQQHYCAFGDSGSIALMHSYPSWWWPLASHLQWVLDKASSSLYTLDMHSWLRGSHKVTMARGLMSHLCVNSHTHTHIFNTASRSMYCAAIHGTRCHVEYYSLACTNNIKYIPFIICKYIYIYCNIRCLDTISYLTEF